MGLYTGGRRFEEHNFIAINRYLCLSDYPEPKRGIHYKKGDIIQMSITGITFQERELINSPVLFEPIEWWVNRSFDELFTIKLVQMNATQYYIPGDILEVDGYWIDADRVDPVFLGFRSGSQKIRLSDVIPLRDYIQYDRIQSEVIYATNK